MLATYYHILKELISIPSISSQGGHVDDHEKIALYLNAMLQDNGFNSEIIHGYGNPIILGTCSLDKSLPTMLLYGHYDVQSADEPGRRTHDPFVLHIGKEKIYGRGVADNKGQFLIHLLSIFSLVRTKKLGYNVIVLLEGNEESGSPHLQQFLLDHRQHLLSDFCLISDSTLLGSTPCIDVGYRGSINMKLTITTARTDLHSGSYGGIVPNAAHTLNTLLAKLYDLNHKITIPYFYYDVDEIAFDVLVKHKKMKMNQDRIMTDTGVKTIIKPKDIDILTQIGLQPTIQITGMSSGYIGDGYKNAIPNTACAHLNFRIVQRQTVQKTINAFEQRLKTVMPEYADYLLEIGDSCEPVKVDINAFIVKKAQAVLEKIFDTSVLHTYSGGSLPIVDILQKTLSIQPVLIPLANEDCNAHGVDENFDIALIEKGFQFAYEFFKK